MKKSSSSPSGENATDPSAHSVLKDASPPAASASPPGQSAALSGQPGQTAWLMVSLAIFAGILAATQVGKAHIALPAIRSDLHLSLVAASWLISAMNFLGLFGASLVGINRSHRGMRKSALKTNTSAWIALSVPVRACFSVWRSRSRCAQLASSCASRTNSPPTKAPYKADPDPDEVQSFETQEASGTATNQDLYWATPLPKDQVPSSTRQGPTVIKMLWREPLTGAE